MSRHVWANTRVAVTIRAQFHSRSTSMRASSRGWAQWITASGWCAVTVLRIEARSSRSIGTVSQPQSTAGRRSNTEATISTSWWSRATFKTLLPTMPVPPVRKIFRVVLPRNGAHESRAWLAYAPGYCWYGFWAKAACVARISCWRLRGRGHDDMAGKDAEDPKGMAHRRSRPPIIGGLSTKRKAKPGKTFASLHARV